MPLKVNHKNILKIGIQISFLLHVFFYVCHSQSPDYSFQHITIEDGLIGTYNWHITKDSRDLVWISSTDGLYRFDGLKIKYYGKKHGLLGENIQSAFYEDAVSNLWFTTAESLIHYDRCKDNITSIPIKWNDKYISSDYHAFHYESQQQILWFSAGEKIFRINTQTGDYHPISTSSTIGKSFVVDTTAFGETSLIYASLWINGPGIEKWERNADSSWISEKYFENGIPSLGLPAPAVSGALIQNKDTLWLFSDQGLLLVDRKEHRVLNAFTPMKSSGMKCKKGVFIDSKHILLSYPSQGLWLFDTKNCEFVKNWTHSNKNKNSPAANTQNAIYIDNQKRLWVSYNNIGIDYSVSTSNKFKNPIIEGTNFQSNVKFIEEDGLGNIWVATQYQGIFVFNKNGEKQKTFSYHNATNDGLDFDEIRSLSRDKSDRMWCMGDTSIYSFNSHGDWEKVYTNSNKVFVFMHHLDSSRTLVTTTNGVYDLIKKDDVYVLELSEEIYKNQNIPTYQLFPRLFQSSDNTLFIPFNDKDVWKAQLINNEIQIIDSISIFAEVFSFQENKEKGLIWMGTSEGLLQLDSKLDTQWLANEYSQIGTTNVFGVLEDDNDQLWFTTKNGLWSYHPGKDSLLHYRKEDGLVSEEFSSQAYLKASDGKMWFGSNNGLTVFHPDSVQPYPHRPKVHIEKMLVNSVPFKTDTAIGEAWKIELNHRENNLTFELRAVGYHLPELSKLKYRLKGYDDTWVTINNGESARFTKVPSNRGSNRIYEFEVMAVNANGLETKEPKVLQVYIEPALIHKTWFRLLVLFILLGIIYASYRYRIAQIRKEAEYKQLVAETETAVLRLQMNPHFIFNSMNSISSYIVQKDIETANDYLGRFATLMRMILKFAAKPMIAVSDEIELLELYLQTEAMRFEKKFEYSFELKNDFDPYEYVIPTMILQPFVENAVWHGLSGKKGEGRILISFSLENESLLCSVEDNGVGRKQSAEQKNKTHESKAMSITHHRLELLKPKNGVTASLEIIDLYDDDKQAAGTKVLLRFPVY